MAEDQDSHGQMSHDEALQQLKRRPLVSLELSKVTYDRVMALCARYDLSPSQAINMALDKLERAPFRDQA
jgi:hypothetical protein